MKKKIIISLCAVALIVAVSVGATMAWLSSQTATVKNTFTYGDINITLTETDTNLDGDGNPNTNTYKMLPGTTIEKDPTVTVLNNSEACWLFVKAEKSGNFDSFLEYTMAEGWTLLEGETNVYYRSVDATVQDTPFGIIAGDTVTVKETVKKEDFIALNENTYPTVSFTAYAVQRDASKTEIATAVAAWEVANAAK